MVVGIILVLVLVIGIGSVVYGHSQPDPSSWTMPKEAQDEFDKRSEW